MHAAIWRYVVGDDAKVTDIYFLTQLTPDEKVAMVSFTHALAVSVLQQDAAVISMPIVAPAMWLPTTNDGH